MTKQQWLALLRSRELWKLIATLLATLGLASASDTVSSLSGPFIELIDVVIDIGSGA